MTTISVYTPSHNARWLDACWASLKAQTLTDFEWVVLLNGGARWTPPDDSRIKVHIADEIRGVGAAKHRACALAQGEILVETDHDDVLTTTALERIAETFDAHPEIGFCYSDGAQIQEDGSKDITRWDQLNGWEYFDDVVEVGGIDGEVHKREVLAVKALEPSPHNIGCIHWAPNHVRAFRRSVYEHVGGYDWNREFLDDQELMSRMYEAADFHHIHETLYLQRTHAGMTQRQADINAAIQTGTVELHDLYIERMALAWAKRRGLLALDLGGAHASPPGYLAVDKVEPADYVGDIFDVLGAMDDSTVGVVRAVDLLEHIPDKIRIANEVHRVLAPDGMLLSCTPSALGQGGHMDPTHCANYVEASFWYLCDRNYQKYVPDLTARFQQSRLVTWFPSDFHRAHDIPYIQFNGVCIKPGGVRNGGYCRW